MNPAAPYQKKKSVRPYFTLGSGRQIRMEFPDHYRKPLLDGGLEWTQALRSGNYSKGRGVLRADLHGGTVHCCLGVWCEVKGYERLGDVYMAKSGHSEKSIFMPEDGSELDSGLFPAGVRVFLPDEKESSWWEWQKEKSTASFNTLNDEYGFSFDEIAEIAEEIYDLSSNPQQLPRHEL